jgi:hypothetical protein
MRHSRRAVAAALATALSLPLLASPAHADGGLTVVATVDGRSVAGADANNPLVLHPSDSTRVQVDVTNHGSSAVEVRSVRLRARVLGLAFFSYTTRVDLTVPPGGTGTRTFLLDLSDLDGQATGLMPGTLDLLGQDRSVLASQSATVDVKGKLLSVYGVFGLAVAGIVALLLLTLGLRLVRRTLPDSRWSRAVLFAVPGLGLGLVAVFSLGALRVLVPSTGVAVGLLVGGTVLGFVLGSLTPAPGDEADRDELDARDVVEAVPARTATPPAPLEPAPVPAAPAPVVPPVAAAPPVTTSAAPETTAVPLPSYGGSETTQVAPDEIPPPP